MRKERRLRTPGTKWTRVEKCTGISMMHGKSHRNTHAWQQLYSGKLIGKKNNYKLAFVILETYRITVYYHDYTMFLRYVHVYY